MGAVIAVKEHDTMSIDKERLLFERLLVHSFKLRTVHIGINWLTLFLKLKVDDLLRGLP